MAFVIPLSEGECGEGLSGGLARIAFLKKTEPVFASVRLRALSSSTASGQNVLAGFPHIFDQFHGRERHGVAPLGENPLHGKVLRHAGKRHRERAAVRREPLP